MPGARSRAAAPPRRTRGRLRRRRHRSRRRRDRCTASRGRGVELPKALALDHHPVVVPVGEQLSALEIASTRRARARPRGAAPGAPRRSTHGGRRRRPARAEMARVATTRGKPSRRSRQSAVRRFAFACSSLCRSRGCRRRKGAGAAGCAPRGTRRAAGCRAAARTRLRPGPSRKPCRSASVTPLESRTPSSAVGPRAGSVLIFSPETTAAGTIRPSSAAPRATNVVNRLCHCASASQ